MPPEAVEKQTGGAITAPAGFENSVLEAGAYSKIFSAVKVVL